MTTLDALGANVLQVLIVVIAALMILGRLGIDIGPAIAGLGIVGIAIGFGAQSLVRDYFNGVLILIENQYDKGDVVRIAGVEGTVEDLTLRRTTLRDFAGNVHTVPNSAVTVASNLTRGYAVIAEEIQVPAAELVEPATDVINGVGRGLAEDPKWADLVLEPPHVERIDALGVSGITLRVSGRVLAGNRWSFAGELRRRLLQAFRDQGLPLVPSAGPPHAPAGDAPPAPPPPESDPASAAVIRAAEQPPAS
jgi:small conductance mechanosensitive channel